MKNKLFILLAAFVLSVTSCNDWLDVKPGTEQTTDIMFESYQGYKDALTGCYMKMKQRAIYGENLTMTTVEYLAQHWDLERGYSGTTADALKRWDYEDDNVKSTLQSIYAGLYNVIVQANSILLAMPETGKEAIENNAAREIIEGEALAIRAFCHFDVLRLFGQMPSGAQKQVRLPYSEEVSREPVSYYDYNAFVGKIEDDLLKAEKLLESDPFIVYDRNTVNALGATPGLVTDEYLRYRPLRLNYWAVKALQARFYLYTGKPEKAYTTAMAVINAENPDGARKFTLQTITSSTTNYALPDEGLFVLNSIQMSDYIPTLFYRIGTSLIYLYMSPTKLASTEMFGEPVVSSSNNRYRYLWDHERRNMYNEACPVLLKYDQTDVATLSASVQMLSRQIIPLFRLSEMYLIAMETSSETLAEVNRLYETYRLARDILGTTFTSKEQVMEMIVKEYRREFFGEGQMFYTYKRMRANRMLWTTDANTTVTESAYVIPLPTTEFDPNL